MSNDHVFLRDLDGTGSMHPCSAGDPGAVAYVPLSSLRRLRAITGVIAANLDLDLDETRVRVKAVSPGGAERSLVEVSLSECFAEVDHLLDGVD